MDGPDSASASFRGHGLESKNVEFDLVTLPDLLLESELARWGARPCGRRTPGYPRHGCRTVRRKRGAYWAQDIEGIWQLLGGVGTRAQKPGTIR